jgi:HSP20 family protein
MPRRTTRKEELEQELEEFKKQVAQILDAVSFSRLCLPPAQWRPLTDIYETDSAIIIKSEISGVKPGDLKISFQDDMLTIQGVRKDHEAKLKYHCLEIPYGDFKIRILVHGVYDDKNIKTSYVDGYLYVVIPKTK